MHMRKLRAPTIVVAAALSAALIASCSSSSGSSGSASGSGSSGSAVASASDASTGSSPSDGASSGNGADSSLRGTTIQVMVATSPSADALKKLAPAFTKQTGITVKFTEVPYTDITAKLLLAARSGKSPYDVAQVDSPMLAPLVAGGALEPMEPVLKANPQYKQDDFPEKVQQYTEYQGKAYGLPLSTEPYVVWYRTDLFKKLGLKPATTWDQYVANAKACKNAGYYGSGLSYNTTNGVYDWAAILYSLGGHILDPKTNKPDLTSDAAKKATEIFMSLLPYTPAATINGDLNKANSVFMSSNVCQVIYGSGFYSVMADPNNSNIVGKFAAATIPQGTSSPTTTLFGWLIGLPTHAANTKGGAAFLMYALSPENLKTFVDLGAPPPGRKSLLDDPAIKEKLPYLPTLLKDEAFAQHFPYVPQMPQILNAISQQLNAAANGTKSIDAALSSAQSAASAALG